MPPAVSQDVEDDGGGGDWDFFLGEEAQVPLNDAALDDPVPDDDDAEYDDEGGGRSTVPTLKADDVRTGALLGTGRFSEVLEVRSIDLPIPAVASAAADIDNRTTTSGGANMASKASLSSLVRNDDDDDEDGHIGGTSSMLPTNATERYALKRLRANIDADDAEAALTGATYLSIEAEILSSLGRGGGHPNIVRLFGVGEDVLRRDKDDDRGELLSGSARPESAFLVLERLEKSTLDERINTTWREQEKPFRKGLKALKSPGTCRMELRAMLLRRVASAASDVARGLDYLQSRGVAHRDIKPDNVGFDIKRENIGFDMMCGTERAKLFDFGFARHFRCFRGCDFDEQKKPTALIGTLLYMAPEVAKGKPYGVDVDIYSFGILLWEMCSLERPYQGYEYRDLHDRVIWGTVRPKLDPAWPEALKELMVRCWSQFPTERPSSEEVVESLTAIAESPDSGSGGGSGGLSGLKKITSLGSLSAMSRKASSNSLKKSKDQSSGGSRSGRRSSIKKSAGSMKRTLSSLF